MRGEGYVFRRKGGRIWYFANPQLGIKAESAKTENKQEAIRQLRVRTAQVQAGLSPDTTKIKLATLINDKLEQLRRDNAPSLRNQIIRARHLLDFFGDIKAKDVTVGRVDDFITWRSSQTYSQKKDGIVKPVSNSEVNRETDLLRSAFNLGKEKEKVQIIPYVPRLKEPSARSGFFERRQLETLLSHLPWAIGQLIRFYYITGWRQKEGSGLLWSSVSFETRRIVLPGEVTKNGLPRVFPFTPELDALFSEQRAYTDKIQRDHCTLVPHVFHRDGAEIKNFRGPWKSACKKAGLAGAIIHSFRRTAVRNLELAGVPRKVAMQMVGMETDSIYNRYRIVAEGELQDAADAMAVFEAKMKGGAK